MSNKISFYYLSISVVFLLFLFLMEPTKLVQADTSLDLRLNDKVVLFVDSPKSYVNNKLVPIDAENNDIVPLIKQGRTMVPVRFISENFGAKVTWHPERNGVSIEHNNVYIQFDIGYDAMGINGIAKKLEAPPETISGRVYLPLRAVVEALGMQVYWENGLIIIGEEMITKEGNEDLINNLITSLKVEKPVVVNPVNVTPQNDKYPVMLNTNGPGRALLQGNQVFYNDGFNKGTGLWTFTYGKENSRKTITTDQAHSMNIKGDWIYYVVPNYTGTFGHKNPIKKVKKTGGSKPITITTDNQISEMVVDGDWIYYVSDNYEQMKLRLNRVKIDGTNKKVLLESTNPYSDVNTSKKGYIKDIHVKDGYIYFLRNDDCGYGLCSQIYRMKTDGTSMVALNKTEYAVRMQIANGKIYYSRFHEDLRDVHKDTMPIDLYSMDMNGKNPTLISKNITGYNYYFIEEFKVHGDWIYFGLWDSVYKMRTDGSSVTKLVEARSPFEFNVVGEWIYFSTPSSSLRIRTNGQDPQRMGW